MPYPTSLDNLSTNIQGTDPRTAPDHAGAHNAERTAINAIEAELGLQPKGTYVSVRARLDAIQAATAGVYTVTNVTTDRSYNANSYTFDEIADVLGTLIADLKAKAIIS